MKFLYFMLTLGVLIFSPITHADNAAIIGEWTTKEGKSRVNISPCGKALCGKIVWLREPTYPADDKKGMAGQTKVDRENPDPELRKHPTLGLTILSGFTYAGDKVWHDGTIYDPENGKTYKSNLTLAGPKLLKVRGYIGFSWIGRTSEWTR